MSLKVISAMPAGKGECKRLDASLARAIDAMSEFRADLRAEGYNDLAGTLGMIIVQCLALYVELEKTGPGERPPDLCAKPVIRPS